MSQLGSLGIATHVTHIMNTHLIRGIAVLVLLIVGWLTAMYFIAKKAKGRRERRFTIRAGIAILLGILTFSALDFFVFKGAAGIFGMVMLFSIAFVRRKQREIRREEAANA